MSWTLDGRPLRRVLVTRLRYLGDVVMATVVADLLREGDPGLAVDFLCEAAHGPVLDGHAALRRVHLLGLRRHGRDARARTPSAAAGRSTVATVLTVRRERYDVAVDLFFNPRSAWLLRLAGVRARIGGARGGRRRLYTHSAAPADLGKHGPDLARLLPGGLGHHASRLAPLRLGKQEFAAWAAGLGGAPRRPHLPRRAPGPRLRAVLEAAGLGTDYVLAAPGATWPSKEWPAGHWRQLLQALPDRLGRPVAVLVPPGRTADWLPPQAPEGVAALPPLPLAEALEAVGGARALVSVDGGVMHAAVAMGVPTLALFGPTDPGVWFPYTGAGPFRVLATRPSCHPCDLHACDAFVCLPDLAPPVVATALVELAA